MHGRVKVRTSEEEKARKDKERKEKLKLFKHAMQTIQDKRNAGECDKELLELTGKVLSSNPDIYTLWNIRREIILRFRENNESKEELSKLYDGDLYLTEYCLKINPKSYCAWHQREWVLITRSDPDWKKELTLCNTYLKLDERNFHTWDYRRFVVGKCKASLKDEFDFTTEKIHDNFSNYSAWHYRSKMLLELYPDLEEGRPIEDSHHKHELKIVQSAAFTDPDDTSAWFYQRWLLGAVKSTVDLVVCVVTQTKTTVAFTNNVPRNFVKSNTLLFFNNTPVNGEWRSCTGNQYDNLWFFIHNEIVTDKLEIKVEYEANCNGKQIITCPKYDPCVYIGKTEISFEKKYSQSVIEELSNQLKACRQLLEMEPNSKWTLLTTTVFLHCIDAKRYHKEVIRNLESLQTIDERRKGYYDDLISKWNIEVQLTNNYNGKTLPLKLVFHEKITSLPYLQYYSYCREVDLSNKNITSQVLPSLILLPHCKVMCLDNNKLNTLKLFPVLELEELSLKGNEDLTKKEVEEFKSKCKYRVIF